MKSLFFVACLVAAASAMPRVRRHSTPDNFVLASNHSAILGREITYGFDCSGREFGYYADPSNACQIFHVCLPQEGEEGLVTTTQWSFLCGAGTIFDQSLLTCNYPEESLPCEEAETLYNINEYFGREDALFLSDHAPVDRSAAPRSAPLAVEIVAEVADDVPADVVADVVEEVFEEVLTEA